MIRHSPEELQQLIDAQRASGMTIAQFCHAHNINQSTFYLHRKKQNEIALPQGNSDWLPINKMMLTAPDTKQWQIELRLRPLPDAYDQAT
jgi:transposase-like protein